MEIADDLKDLLDVVEEPSRADREAARLLSKADREKIVSWLKKKQRNSSCPVCGTNHWTVGDHLIHGFVASLPGVPVMLGGQNYPMAMVVCDNCLYTRHFMAMPMGLDFLAGDGVEDV